MIVQYLLQNLRSKAIPILCMNRPPSIITSSVIRRAVSSSPVLCKSNVSKREEYFLKKDKIPPGYNIIYRAPMEYYLTGLVRGQFGQQIAGMKFFAPPIKYDTCNCITSFSFVALAGISFFTYFKDFHHIVVPLEIEYATLSANETDLIYFVGCFFIINVLIRIVINRYPLRIYRNDKKYLAVFEGQVPLMTKQLTFQKGDVVPVPSGGILPWQDSRYKINDRNVLLLDEHFRTPAELNTMMKHDEPDGEQ